MDNIILGGIGLLIYSKLKKILKNQEKQNVNNCNEISNINNDYQEKLKENEELINNFNGYKIKAEKIIRNIETFEDSIIFQGIINNTLAISKSGYIFITSYGESQLIEVENIIGMNISKQKINEILLYYLIILVKNKEKQKYKMLLTMGNKERANELLNEIKIEIKKAKPAPNKL